MKKHVVLAILTVLLFNTNSPATTVIPIEFDCPVCNETFVSNVFGSYSIFHEPARDLRDSMFCADCKTCPYCLFSSLNWDFSDISDDEITKLKQFLKAPRLEIHPTERKEIQQDFQEDSLYTNFYSQLLTRHCNQIRQTNIETNVALARLMYYRTYGNPPLESHYLQQLIDILSDYLNNENIDDDDRAIHTYLLGEMYRQAGQDRKALKYFDAVQKQIKDMATIKHYTLEDSMHRLAIWAIEQSSLIKFHNMTAEQLRPFLISPPPEGESPEKEAMLKIAIQILMQRNEPDDQKVFAEYIKNTECLDFIKDQINRKKWHGDILINSQLQEKTKTSTSSVKHQQSACDSSYMPFDSDITEFKTALNFMLTDSIFQNYTIQQGDNLTFIADKNKTTIERLLELNPKITNPDSIKAGGTLRLPKTPNGWNEKDTLSTLNTLLKQNDPQAVQYFMQWLTTVQGHSLDRHFHHFRGCLKTLAETSNQWDLPEFSNKENSEEQDFLYLCLAYFKGDKSLTSMFPFNNDAMNKAALFCFTVKKDTHVKPKIFDFLMKKKDIYFFTMFYMRQYLSEVSDKKDIPTLKQIAHLKESQQNADHINSFTRKRIEELILEINLKELFSQYQ